MKSLVLLFFLTGCMVGPNYIPPEIQVSNAWTKEEPTVDSPLVKWWEIFSDPLLNQYIASAEKHNFDVLTAEANILRARSYATVTASSLFPQVSADFVPMKMFFSKNGPFFSNPLLSPFSELLNLFTAFFDASWEIDLFGKTRRALQQANAMVDSAIEQKNDTLISVFAELARNYMMLRSFQERKQLTERNIACYEESVFITRKNLSFGYANELQLANIEAQLENAKGALPGIAAEIYRTIYTLSILTGELPETLVDQLIQTQPLPKAPANIAVGLRSDLLRRRPDVRRAERNLAAATANVGVAVASFFPNITLFGLGGLQALQWPELFDWQSRLWTYGGDVSMPIFEGGKIVGNLHFARAEQTAMAFTYRQAVLSAIQEAESSLVRYTEELKASGDFAKAVSRNEKAVHISSAQLTQGLINRITLLNAEEQLISAQLTSLNSDTAALVALVALYKALGGGWEKEEGCQSKE